MIEKAIVIQSRICIGQRRQKQIDVRMKTAHVLGSTRIEKIIRRIQNIIRILKLKWLHPEHPDVKNQCHGRAKAMDAAIAMLLAMTLASIAVSRDLAVSITSLVRIIMRSARSIIPDSNARRLSHLKSPQNATGEFTTFTEHRMANVLKTKDGILLVAYDLEKKKEEKDT